MKAKKTHVAMGVVLAFSLILFSLGLSASLWVGLIWWVGPWKTVLATIISMGAILTTFLVTRRRKEKWIPEDAHNMAQGLHRKWGFTVEEAWEVVELMENILRSEHSIEQAQTMVRILRMRTDKDRTLAILRNLARDSPARNQPTNFPKVLNT